MVSFKESRVIDAPVSEVWQVISDVDRDAMFWSGINSVRNIRKAGNVVDREAVVGIIGSKSRQTITLVPVESVEMEMTKGPLKGSRRMEVSELEDGKKTALSVSWDFQFDGAPPSAQAFVDDQLLIGTIIALRKIAAVAEAKGGAYRRRRTAGAGRT